MPMPKWFFAMSGLILIVVGVGLMAVRERPKYERGLARVVNFGNLWAATVILMGVVTALLGLGVIPWPRWR